MAEVLSSSKHATVVKADLWGASDKIWKKDLSKNCMKLVWQSSICVAQFFNGRYSRYLPNDNSSNWFQTITCVSHGSNHSPLTFFTHTVDITMEKIWWHKPKNIPKHQKNLNDVEFWAVQ